MRTSATIWGRSSHFLLSPPTSLSQTGTPSHLPTLLCIPNLGVCSKLKTLDWSYPVAIPGNPRVVFKPLPTACKERREKNQSISAPSCDLAHKEIWKINVIHNLYHLTLARKQPLGPTLSRTVLHGWIWDSCTRCQDWLGGNAPGSSSPQTRKCLFPCRGYLIPPKGGRVGRGKQPLSTPLRDSPLARAQLRLRSWKPFSKVGTRQTIVLLTSHSPERKLL